MKKTTHITLLFLLLIMTLSICHCVPASAASVKPGRPVISSVKILSDGRIKVKWKKAENAKKYQVYLSVNGGSYSKVQTLKTRTYTVEDPLAGAVYRFKIRALNGKKKSSYSRAKKIRAFTAWGYYTALKEKMLKKGKVDAKGNPMLATLTTDGGDTCTTAIIFNKVTSSFNYYFNCVTSTYEYSVTMDVTQSSVGSRQVTVNYTYLNTSNQKGFNSSAALAMASFTNDTDVELSFVPGTVNGNYKSITIQAFSNVGLYNAFSKWAELSKNTGRIQLYNLGFPSLKQD